SVGCAHYGGVGSGASVGPRGTHRAAAAKLPSAGVAEPADRHRRLRTADARAAGGATVCRRFPPGTHLEQSRGLGDTLERARITPAELTWIFSVLIRSMHRRIRYGRC